MYLGKEPIIRELNIPKDILKQCEEIMNDNKFSPYYKQRQTRDLLGVAFCSSCASIPELEISYAETGVTRIVHFCKICYVKSLEREKELPQTKEDIAKFYGCTVAEPGTFGRSKKEYEQ